MHWVTSKYVVLSVLFSATDSWMDRAARLVPKFFPWICTTESWDALVICESVGGAGKGRE